MEEASGRLRERGLSERAGLDQERRVVVAAASNIPDERAEKREEGQLWWVSGVHKLPPGRVRP